MELAFINKLKINLKHKKYNNHLSKLPHLLIYWSTWNEKKWYTILLMKKCSYQFVFPDKKSWFCNNFSQTSNDSSHQFKQFSIITASNLLYLTVYIRPAKDTEKEILKF